ncbi:hypothetical protein CCACVL1_21825 [Corchorus capsularis]|uniref:Uncharacterized protein n=1 Tax=Corchorus capsularis TaxID=210143 RepID=A0A1R3H1Z6_COCAP|nr:hypothetical protein CCACVL1_21825 [Corchorus capsularis]
MAIKAFQVEESSIKDGIEIKHVMRQRFGAGRNKYQLR